MCFVTDDPKLLTLVSRTPRPTDAECGTLNAQGLVHDEKNSGGVGIGET